MVPASAAAVANALNSAMTTKLVKREESGVSGTVFSEKKGSAALPEGDPSIRIPGADSVSTYYLKRGSAYPQRHEVDMLDPARSVMTLNKDLSPGPHSPVTLVNA